jgi:hypothetical protein
VKANEVLWIGDGWVTVPGSQHTRVRDLARTAGTIGINEDYVLAAMPSTTLSAIAGQYATQEAGATKPKVVIMDGGTWDTLFAINTPAAVASMFSQFLATVASDGSVEQVIYFLPPELPMITGVPELRPLLSDACRQSAVPCHFLDLQSFWVDGYTASDGFLPNDAGARALGEAIWAVMQDSCIAQ